MRSGLPFRSSRPDARSPATTLASSNRRPARPELSAQARKEAGTRLRSRPASLASRGRDLRDGVMWRGLGRREEPAEEWRCRRDSVARTSPGLRALPLPPPRPPAAPATTSCRGEGLGYKRWVSWTRGWASGGSRPGGTLRRELVSKEASRRLLFGESEGRGSLSTPGVDNG